MGELKTKPWGAGSGSAWRQLWHRARVTEDFRDWQALGRARRRIAAQEQQPPLPATARIALLGGATTDLMLEPLQLALEAAGVASTMHVPAFNTFAREMLDPASGTATFGPDIAIVAPTPANLPRWPSWNASTTEVDSLIEDVCGYFLGLCDSLHARTGCDVVLDNFHALPLRPLGSAGTRAPGDANRFLAGLNEALARHAGEHVHIHDVAALAALHGIYRWFDMRFWYLARQPVSFDCLVPYVRSLAQLIGALRGASAKCVVIDLDNTLWGGVVGDDGPERIVIGEGDPQGEAYAAFQRYLLQLRQRGVMLAVCSKNDARTAEAPFVMRPEMVLRRKDFVAFHANWRPKSENIRDIAAALNIGLDAIVFVDDNPAEREEVRQALPDVRIVEPGEDPSGYALALDRTGWLDAVTLTAEDRMRSAMVDANSQRTRLRHETGDYDTYLRSLEQRAVIVPFEERYLDRITQLTNKTNQFNLTTRRMTRAELAAWAAAPDRLTACARLADRFGDNGLISVFAAHADGDDLWIDLWLMSCRVFNRGLEHLLCNHVVERAAAMGMRRAHGVFLPTARNGIVREHYAAMGFERGDPLEHGDHWILELERYTPFRTNIRLVDDYRIDNGGTAND